MLTSWRIWTHNECVQHLQHIEMFANQLQATVFTHNSQKNCNIMMYIDYERKEMDERYDTA